MVKLVDFIYTKTFEFFMILYYIAIIVVGILLLNGTIGIF